MLRAWDNCGNASSIHEEGRRARAELESARETIAERLGVLPQMVLFTSGGTEANNLALKGAPVERIVFSTVEHPSVTEAARAAGVAVETVAVDSEGIVRLDALKSILANSPLPTLVSIMLANNETGAIQPLAEVAALARDCNAIVHTDAVQAFGKIPVNFNILGIDLLTVSAHKLGGPVGAGALIIREGLRLKPQFHGGGQEHYRRAGTENAAAVAGFAAAIAESEPDSARLRDRLERELEGISPDVEFFSRKGARLPNTSCFAVKGVPAEMALINLDLDGMAVSSGSACSSGKVGRSTVLSAMGVSTETAGCAIRVSLGWNSTDSDIESFIGAWRRLTERTKKRAA